MPTKKQETYRLRYTFSALGEDAIQELRQIRDKLPAPDHRASREVQDTVRSVGLVFTTRHRIERKSELHGFLAVTVDTTGTPTHSFWLNICKQAKHPISLNVVGANASCEHRICETLYPCR